MQWYVVVCSGECSVVQWCVSFGEGVHYALYVACMYVCGVCSGRGFGGVSCCVV